MNKVVTIITWIIIVGIITVLVSKNSKTADVITSFGAFFVSAVKEIVTVIPNNNTSTSTAQTSGGALTNPLTGQPLITLASQSAYNSQFTPITLTSQAEYNATFGPQTITVELPGTGETQTGGADFTAH